VTYLAISLKLAKFSVTERTAVDFRNVNINKGEIHGLQRGLTEYCKTNRPKESGSSVHPSSRLPLTDKLYYRI